MAATAQGRAQKVAHTTLHLLLDHLKFTLGRAAEDRVEPEDFFPVDTRLLVDLVGWTLEEVTMVGYTSWGEPLAARSIRAETIIMLLSSLSEEAKRFSLAHELGHVLLHTEIPDCNAGNVPRMLSMLHVSDKKRKVEYSGIEREAEIFARELLMPERAVRRHFRQLFSVDQFRASSELGEKLAPRANRNSPGNRRDVAEEIAKWSNSSTISLADFFGVSRRAMSSRLTGLYFVY